MGLTAGREGGREGGRDGGRLADEMQVGFENFKILYRLNYLGFYFVWYHSNVTTLLKLHFSQLLSSKAYFNVFFKCKKFSSHFFHVNSYYPTIRY